MVELPHNLKHDKKVTAYNSILRAEAVKFAPCLIKVIKLKSTALWFDCDCEILRRKRQKVEKKVVKRFGKQDKNEFTRLKKETIELEKE